MLIFLLTHMSQIAIPSLGVWALAGLCFLIGSNVGVVLFALIQLDTLKE
jgi:hypothetical protein